MFGFDLRQAHQSIKPGKDQTVCATKGLSLRRMPSQYVNLMLGTKISAANEDRVRNNPINAVQIRLQASFI